MSTMPAMLQNRPPLVVALGNLRPIDRSHIQIALHTVFPHVPLKCQITDRAEGDIVIVPGPQPDRLRISSGLGFVDLDHPVRLSPLVDAMQTLVGQMLDEEKIHPVDGGSQADASATTANHSDLLALLLGRSQPAPLKITSANGQELLIDAAYHSAWTRMQPQELDFDLLYSDTTRVSAASADELAIAQAKGSGFHRMSVEQVCWKSRNQADIAARADWWVKAPNTRIALDTWPNLSFQADAEAWLRLLAAIHHRPCTFEEALRYTEVLGIPQPRARHGLTLLLLYNHLGTTGAIEPSSLAPGSFPAIENENAQRPGLFTRLRSRMRALLN